MEIELSKFSTRLCKYMPSRDFDAEEEFLEVLLKKKALDARKYKGLSTWSDISKVIQTHSKSQNPAKEIATFSSLVQHLVGYDCPQEHLERGCIFALKMCQLGQTFQNIPKDDLKEIDKHFNSAPKTLVEQTLQCAYKLLSSVPKDKMNFKFDSKSKHEEFGHFIKLEPFKHFKFDSDLLWLRPPQKKKETGFTMNFEATFQKNIPSSSSTNNHQKTNFLDKHLTKIKHLNPSIVRQSLSGILMSAKTDDDLQEQLIGFLGFDNIELIGEIMLNRKLFLQELQKSNIVDGKKTNVSNPSFGMQVVVQNENQKKLQKSLNKEEKKIRKNNDVSHEDKQLNFNDFKAKREAVLQLSKKQPLFSKNSSAKLVQAPEYPYVFDNQQKAKSSASFVAKVKIVLPSEINRKDNDKMEQFDIPASSKPPIEMLNKQVLISEMDEIGQIAFQNTKKLNLIQSVVYPTAYTTNENLLICAPTGAGKTNIAMLTVVKELRNHLENGIIKKDEFKIIYIAPMKALAAEMVENFGKRLKPLGIAVREFTGDMQLTKSEISATQMIVTTPEKWDVVTRKPSDESLSKLVRLLIIDEVHLLHDERGCVIESIVARTLRQVESSQTMIRIVGLSATLPNYIDVATFLRVNPYAGLFFFDSRFRPVPLTQTFIGVKDSNYWMQMQTMNSICYDKVVEQVKQGYQVMVFVHSRNDTVKTAELLLEMAKDKGQIQLFFPPTTVQTGLLLKQTDKSSNKKLRDLVPQGFATHHAGMLRHDRNLVEKLFAEGTIKVIVCTATLAWGVNLPAHAVIIKGTQIYDAKKGTTVDLSILDVTQIFGRAGRPQFDTFGHGTIITTHDKLPHYLTLLVSATPIESQFITGLEDHLNAEISLGSVTNVDEAIRWLSYTYLFVRMRLNPLVYGVQYDQLKNDPMLEKRRRELITSSCKSLDKTKMIRYDEKTESLHSTSLGRTASHYYIKYTTIEIFNELLTQFISREEIFNIISKAEEFNQIKVREEEQEELQGHLHDCSVDVSSGVENTHGKVNVLIQSYISRIQFQSFSLTSDQAYIVQSASRISRSLFEIAMNNGWPLMADRVLSVSKFIEKRLWWWQNPMRQFTSLSHEILDKIENRGLSVDKLRDMDIKEIGQMINHMKMGPVVKDLAHQLPTVSIEWNLQPVTRTVLKITLTIKATFKWNDKVHGKVAEPFWMWIEDPVNNHIYHYEYVLVHKKNVVTDTPIIISFTIPIFEPLPSQYYIRVVSDTWLGSDDTVPITFQHLILPEKHPPHTELLDLQPLPKKALNNVMLEELYKFSHFNPIQTQVFHTLYHQDGNVLIGAPTGSGKTIMAELAIFRVFREYPKAKAVYIAPLKALVRERMEDWKVRIEQRLGKKVVELTGDVMPDMKAVAQADLIVTTPEKWDGISRSWQNRSYVKAVALLVIDEIHLLGDDRGPVLEVIVSRTNFISSHTDRKVRVVGLSTALANARDLADWLGIQQAGLYNFRPSVRPVPLEVHIAGFPGKHYCPRMATMNKPTFQAIEVHSPHKPVLVFVSSRRQTRLTALDLIAFLAAADNPKQWLHLPENEVEIIISTLKDSNLKLTLAFGIGIHHAGLHEHDRKVVEELFVNQKIQVLIATSTLAWGVNFPAHLVVIKGTEYFDGKLKKYVDFPITDVLQMMGRAGRPQFDDQGKAVVLVHDVKKSFYKKFLYEPFPVESSLLEVLSDHLNAEIVAGTICTKQDAVDYLTWTYFFRRLINNPSYYGLENLTHEVINKFLSSLIQKSLINLTISNCVLEDEDNVNIIPITGGKIASYYYLSHFTIRHFKETLNPECSVENLLKILSNAHEFSLLPVRHNEDHINEEFSTKLPIKVEAFTFDKASTKTLLLFQAHFSRCPLPSSDYLTDTKSVMDQALRVLQAMLDLSAEEGWLVTTLQVIHLVQMVVQGLWIHQNPLLCLPYVNENTLSCFKNGGEFISSLPQLMHMAGGKSSSSSLEGMLRGSFSSQQINQIIDTLNMLPVIKTSMTMLQDSMGDDEEEDVASKSKPKIIRIFHQEVSRKASWTKISAGREYSLSIELTRMNENKKRDNHVYPSKFQKPKEEGWILVLGEVETKNVLALKKVGFVRHKSKVQLLFTAPEKPGRVIYTLYVMSDSYLNLDQQYEILFEVTN